MCTGFVILDIYNSFADIHNVKRRHLQLNYDYRLQFQFQMSSIYFCLVTLPVQDIFNFPQFKISSLLILDNLNQVVV